MEMNFLHNHHSTFTFKCVLIRGFCLFLNSRVRRVEIRTDQQGSRLLQLEAATPAKPDTVPTAPPAAVSIETLNIIPINMKTEQIFSSKQRIFFGAEPVNQCKYFDEAEAMILTVSDQ